MAMTARAAPATMLFKVSQEASATLSRHRLPRTRGAQSCSQHSPHTGGAQCDCSHTLASSFAQLYSHEANIPSRTAWTSCRALLSSGDSLEFTMGKSLLLPSPASPEANHYQAEGALMISPWL
ncbi:hypothetical protein RLOC_00009797 [Lonchura striata]|uniref:Uncharacterized protein n=1 Tax=Lonchura striata TaxID=40157 RepID=A0A218VBX4_9PASE|nr:hypothetical protein RLOC_00009797 [Lonchura striata domestica]